MKSIYQKPIMTIEFFDEKDVMTVSNTDGLGFLLMLENAEISVFLPRVYENISQNQTKYELFFTKGIALCEKSVYNRKVG